MKKTSFFHRTIAIFLTLNFLTTIIPVNQLYANNNGPNSPEAASFEPVDATDMVNLLTGDFSYVLPMLSVPSPEGGYPISLSYHGGIPLNLDATWVGLGWNLNPGAINRTVSGFPDDWGETKVHEFFYDEGWTEEYYNVGVGGNIYGVDVGIGASWGSNRSLGGSVSLGFAGYNITAGRGNSVSIGYGNGIMSANIGTNGVGVGLGVGKGAGKIGVGLNYSWNGNLSGSISGSLSGTIGGKGVFSGTKVSSSIGVSFNTKGLSGVTIAGTNVNLGGGNGTGGNYDVHESGFHFNAYFGVVWASFGYTKYKYSIHKYDNLNVTGGVYPYHSSYTKKRNTSHLLEEKNLMDVKSIVAHSSLDLTYNLIDADYSLDKNNIVLPNYDNYIVNAQGLSGIIKPSTYEELLLSDRGRGEQNEDNLYSAFVNKPLSYSDYSSDLGGDTHFYFENSHNSFLRVNKGNIAPPLWTNVTSASDYSAFLFGTGDTNIDYSLTHTPLGEKLMKGNKKREGNYIETYTNKQIREDNILGFIEASGIDRQETETFLDRGIGAYKITTIDGKTYHYSLPVYNYELFFKSFGNKNNENESFFEVQKEKPYATHWLLTAVTGPDYIDSNADGKLDEGDYGYWVELDYGKWSDGYGWRGPKEGFDTFKNKDGKETYSYYWGRKQIYYLDAIKTRTHTALFVKNLRDDDLSSGLNIYNQKWNSGNFNENYYSKRTSNSIPKIIGHPNDKFYTSSGDEHTIIEVDNSQNTPHYVDYVGATSYIKSLYLDSPINKSLKLEKIILLKNKDAGDFKSNGELINTLKGYYSSNFCYYNLGHVGPKNLNEPNNLSVDGYPIQPLYENVPSSIKSFDINQHKNVLDIKDIENLNLEQKAQQLISFTYDYSLAKNSSNSEANGKGRLTLKEVNYKGKQGHDIVPPYKFSYNAASTSYNKEDKGVWGYHKTIPEVWSLNEITTPTGGKIKINYESDSYFAEAAYNDPKIGFSRKYDGPIESIPPSPQYFIKDDIENLKEIGNLLEVTIKNHSNEEINESFRIDSKVKLTFNYWLSHKPGSAIHGHYHKKYDGEFKVKYIEGTKIILEKLINTPNYFPESEIDGISQEIVDQPLYDYYHDNWPPIDGLMSYQEYTSYLSAPGEMKRWIKNITLFKNEIIYTRNDSNGKKGGGLRVKSLQVEDNNNTVTTEYFYTNPNTNNISGITSYAPSGEPKGVPYISEIPSPSVMYGYVGMKTKDDSNAYMGKTVYHFEVLEPFKNSSEYLFSMGDIFKVKEMQNEGFLNNEIKANKYTIYSKLSNIGRLNWVKTFNVENHLLSQKTSNYKEYLDGQGEIGVTQESYKSIKRVRKNGNQTYYINSSSKVMYPSVLKSTLMSAGGQTSKTSYDKYDFLTGQVLETSTISSDGTKFKTKVVPAYTITEYSGVTGGYGMGPKVDNVTNSNMLSQAAASYSYLYDTASSSWKETGVGISTWNNAWSYRDKQSVITTPTVAKEKIWRKHKSYVWKGEIDSNGVLQGFTNDFNWGVGAAGLTQSSGWQNILETTLYDHYSVPLEVRDINNNYSSTKMDVNDERIIAVSNAKYSEMYYADAEQGIEGQSIIQREVRGHSVSETKAHTGTRSVKATTAIKGFEVTGTCDSFGVDFKLNDTYKISVWVHKDNYTNARLVFNGVSKQFNGEIVPAGDWILMNHYEKFVDPSYVIYTSSANGDVYYDDFRLHPMESSMSSYVYNNWGELWYILGANNLASRFEYDDEGRLIKTYTEVIDNATVTGGFKLLSENNYNFKLN
ncbi:MAG: hypothetical protein COA88_07210 [Kordia sp.]|nr:MAG: hypothetical protein COA88_07210 [Kordia sp.]